VDRRRISCVGEQERSPRRPLLENKNAGAGSDVVC
jgi:hypothetical protein